MATYSVPYDSPKFFQLHRETPEISLAEILSALSFALDLTEGAIPGHAVRTTLLGMRIARVMGVTTAEESALYYALQLKDIGCSSNAARMSQIFGGDDRAAKAMTKLSDWSGLFAAASLKGDVRETLSDLGAGMRAVPSNLRALWSTVKPEASASEKIRHILELNRQTESNTRELIALRCERGGSILHKLGMSELTCESIRCLDEHWDGSGYPDALRGEQIPLLARVIAVAQNLDVFAVATGVPEAMTMLRRRNKTWFDPEVVSAALSLNVDGLLWKDCRPETDPEVTRRRVINESPVSPTRLHADQVDTICEVFADVVDAKSPFTFRHSLGVAEVTTALAEEMQVDEGTKRLLERAALLHDLGKLGVSNSILDKPGRLTPEEMEVIWQHPANGQTILARIQGFEEIAQLAEEHHEKLDGSGYPHHLPAQQISLETRLLTIADCFTALIEHRPYREDLSVDMALAILRRDVGTKLDSYVFEALEAVVRQWTGALPPVFRERVN